MKRRSFGLLAGTSLAAAATATATGQSAQAQSAPDVSQLTTTLTPMGAERAGNADGTIPPWTGGMVGDPLPPGTSDYVQVFQSEQPLYTITASNMAQYADMLTPATQVMLTKWGLTINVFPTHRTAACPQYVYDNAAKNATTAQLDPRGGRLGFTGGYGAPPFPIIDTSDPLTAGAQLIWNHLTAWLGYCATSLISPGCAIINGAVILVNGAHTRTIYPYYDPNGTLEDFAGYYSKGHYSTIAPASVQGQETLVWHSTNVNIHPDIIWTLLNGQGRVRKDPNEAYDSPNPDSDGVANVDESSVFYGNPSEYDWTFVEKKEMLVPYNGNAMLFHPIEEMVGAHFPNPNVTRWEKHRVWVLDANLHPGIRNVDVKRRLYIDEDTWNALLAEAYDADGTMVKSMGMYLHVIPSLPGVIEQATTTQNLITGDWIFNGANSYGPFQGGEIIGVVPPSNFDPQAMAAQASF